MPTRNVTYSALIVPDPSNWDGIIRVSGQNDDTRAAGICVPIKSARYNAGVPFFYGTALQFVSTFQLPGDVTRDSSFMHSLHSRYDRPSYLAGISPADRFRGRYLHINKSEVRRLVGDSPVLSLAEELAQIPGSLIRELVDTSVTHLVRKGLHGKMYAQMMRDDFPRFPQIIISAAQRRGEYQVAQRYVALLPAMTGDVSAVSTATEE
jgi:hypothetical protein